MELVEEIPNAIFCGENTYSLFCMENLEFISSISSGALEEARNFGKKSIPLINPDRNSRSKLPLTCGAWVSVAAEDFLGKCFPEILGIVGNNFTEKQLSVFNDSLDVTLGARWGFSEENKKDCFYEFGDELDFSSGCLTMSCMVYGWSIPESWGVWSDGEFANLVIPIEKRGVVGDYFILEIDGDVFLENDIDRPSIKLNVSGYGIFAYSENINYSGIKSIKILVNNDLNEAEKLILSLSFKIKNPVSPIERGISLDARKLGYGLKSIKII